MKGTATMEPEIVPERPEPGERCSAFARRSRATVLGTGMSASAILVLDVPTPWPHSIEDDPSIAMVGSHPSLIRLAAVPQADETPMATLFLRARSGSAESWSLPLEDTADDDWRRLADCLDRVAGGPIDPEWWEPAGWTRLQPRRVWLICTHGSRDVCCGSKGASFAAEVRRDVGFAFHRRVSHLGGHRFAPTMIEMPSGRTWAYATTDLIRSREAGLDAAISSGAGRGWWGAAQGPEQIGEWAAMEAAIAGHDDTNPNKSSQPFDPANAAEVWDRTERVVKTDEVGDGQFVVSVESDDAEFRVEIRRTDDELIPACGQVDGPHKTTKTFAVNGVMRVR